MATTDTHHAPLQDLLARLENDGTGRQFLIELVQWHRPPSASAPEQAAEKLNLLIYTLWDNEQHRSALSGYIYRLFESRNSVRAFTELGIQSFRGFFSESWRKLGHKFLPPASGKRADAGSVLRFPQTQGLPMGGVHPRREMGSAVRHPRLSGAARTAARPPSAPAVAKLHTRAFATHHGNRAGAGNRREDARNRAARFALPGAVPRN